MTTSSGACPTDDGEFIDLADVPLGDHVPEAILRARGIAGTERPIPAQDAIRGALCVRSGSEAELAFATARPHCSSVRVAHYGGLLSHFVCLEGPS